jgi:hypothetical protein
MIHIPILCKKNRFLSYNARHNYVKVVTRMMKLYVSNSNSLVVVCAFFIMNVPVNVDA